MSLSKCFLFPRKPEIYMLYLAVYNHSANSNILRAGPIWERKRGLAENDAQILS
jgi:hypothetical protein